MNTLNIVKMLRDINVPVSDIQQKFIESSARFKVFRAARRVGKSKTAADASMAQILLPNTRGWIVGPTYDLAEKEFRYILDYLFRMHKKFGLPRPTAVRDNPKAGELYIKTPWGSEVHGKSADRPLSLVGEENDWIILSEAAQHKEDTWSRYLRPTLVTRKGTAIIPTTPDLQGFWLYELEQKIEAWRAGGDDAWELFTCAAWDCDHFPEDEIAAAKRDMGEDEFAEQIGGEWRFHTGRVYKSYKPSVHLIDSFKIPKSWKVRAGIDYGLRDATCVEYQAESPDGDFYFCDEYYSSDRPTETHVSFIKHLEYKYSMVGRVADHHALGAQLRVDWARLGIPTLPVTTNIKGRRDRFLSYLDERPDRYPFHIRREGGSPGTYPRLFIFRDKCPNLARELLFLRWKEGQKKEGSYGDTVGDDHAIDAAEYAHTLATKTQYSSGKQKRKRRRTPVNSRTGY